ncbi:MAG: PaaI family thioesterase [bacterium]|nr:PaaI family thioesterase [bacterium]
MSQPTSDFNGFVGIAFDRAEEGICEMTLDVDDRHLSIAERVHGGVFFTMIDTAMGRSVISTLPAGRGCATIEAKINYFRPVQQGRVRVVARCVNTSRRTAYAEAEIRDDEDRLICKATGTFMLTETMAQKERERF